MIKIDFHGSTHGHFLEYVSNVYIMQTTPSRRNIFKAPSFSAHNPDHYYFKDRIIECGHFSDPIYNLTITDQDQMIRIVIDQSNDNTFFIAFTNLLFKAGDVGIERQLLNISDSIRADRTKFRNTLYSKFNEREKYANYYGNFLPATSPVFEFKVESFFSFKNFCVELSKLADFLNQTFFVEQSLYLLWEEFITKNQGWQSYIKCNQVLEHSLANKDSSIDCTVLEEAWINYNLSQVCKLYTGPSFEGGQYPTNTQLIYEIIQNHTRTLR